MTPISHNHHRYVQQRRPRRAGGHNSATTPPTITEPSSSSCRHNQQHGHVQPLAQQTPTPEDTLRNPAEDLIVRSPSGDLGIPDLDILVPENPETERIERDREEIKKVLEASYSRLHLQENEEAQKLVYSSLREMVNLINQDEQALI